LLTKDVQASEAKAYKSNRSHMTVDGRELLYDEDWQLRKWEVWCRGKGLCETHLVPELRHLPLCRNRMDDPHHLVPRSKGRNDSLDNLAGLCRMHHRMLDRRKPSWAGK
jgi:hypothetical protein